MKVIIMKSPNNEGKRAQTIHFLSPNEASVLKWIPSDWIVGWRVQTISHSTQTGDKALVLTITPTQIIYCGDIDVVPHHFQVHWFLVLGGSLHTTKRKVNTNVVTKHLTYCGDLTVGTLVQLMMEKKFGYIFSQYLNWLKALYRR